MKTSNKTIYGKNNFSLKTRNLLDCKLNGQRSKNH